MLEAASVKSSFQSKNITLSDDWLDQCLDWVKTEYPNGSYNEYLSLIYEEWLNLDLRDVQIPVLPPNVNESVATMLQHPIHLQLLYVVDISKPKFLQLRSIRSKFDDHTEDEETSGMLKLQLTDGVQDIAAIEYRKVPGLHLNLAPGLKVHLIPPVTIKRGQIMLEPGVIEICGGCVPEIAVSNCYENILATALKQPLNNNPFGNKKEKIPMQTPYNSGVNLNEMLANAINSTNATNFRNNNLQNEILASNSRDLDLMDNFDDIINDDFFNHHLDNIETNDNQPTTNSPLDEDEFPYDDEDFSLINAQPMEMNENVVDLNSRNINRVNQAATKYAVEEPVEVTKSTTNSVKRPIMKIAKLNQIRHKIPKGTFNISMEIISISRKLQVVNDSFTMKVMAADESGEIEVEIVNQVLQDLLGITPTAFRQMFENYETDHRQMQKFVETMTDKINSFFAHVVLSVEANKDPTITEVLETFEL